MCQKKNYDDANTISNTNRSIENSLRVENLSNTTLDQTFLQTLLVKICGNGHSRLARAIIDTGSQRSYITKQAAMEMKYEVLNSESIVHALFGGEHSELVNHKCYRVTLKNMEENYMCNFNALDQTVICSSIGFIREGPWKLELTERGISVSDVQGGPIEILFGADIAGKLFTGKRYVLPCGLVAMETVLGWTLMGRVANNNNITRSSSMTIFSLICSSDISYLWNLDILGISDPVERKINKDAEKEIMKKFTESIKINDEGRYEVGLTWIDGHPPLPNNFDTAKRRLDYLMKKLDGDGYYDMYEDVFCEWLQEGIIEEISSDGTYDDSYYLPHRHVVKLSSATTKLRPVFDASAKEKNQPSLNQCLDKGINLIELIPSILIRFRCHKIGVISDIKKAFLQISLKNEDRRFLRFLWYDKKGNLKIFQHARVVFGVTCSPFHLAAVINYHLDKMLRCNKKYCRKVLLKLMNGFYVDNCVVSVDNEEQLCKFIREASEIMMEGKFDLRGWEYTLSENGECTSDSLSSVLGLIWNRLTDTLEINFEWLETINTEIVTKRTILSIAHRLFDPIGFSCPVQIIPRILLQKTWILKIKWDEAVPDDIKNIFLRWLNEVQFLRQLKVPRWLLKNYSNIWSLHMFCDASKEAYGAAVFLRTEYAELDQAAHIQLVQAKSRISPVKQLTIPRLELLAATIGARLLASIVENIDNPNIKIYCWTDSTTVLSWIRREDFWKPFIWNRIQEIRSLTGKNDWFHVPGHMNPADLPSRGCLPKELSESRWWEGPVWLKDEKDWPEQKFEVNDEEILKEKRKEVSLGFLNLKKDFSSFYKYFSHYKKNLNQIAWIKRFIFNCQHAKEKKMGKLSVEEIEDAEIILMKLVQEESFSGTEDKNISSLYPFIDEKGVMRIKTKITERSDTQDFIYPILLPSRHLVTEKLIFHYHLDACHVGIQGLLCRIRERFWILGGRRTVKRVIAKCIICRRFDAQKMRSCPVTLPVDRVRDAAVFEIIGVDLAGPLFLRSREKVWICLFTCAVYRAIHLEIVCSLSTETFLLAFRRFIARRGRPAIVYSDNGTNFVGTENCLKNIDWNKIEACCSVDRIRWKFNPPAAAWWGGWWERLIRILKNLLRRQLGKACLSYEELHTVLCDCEAVINSRPLTYISENPEDLMPLTPAMFLQEIRECGVPDLDNIDATSLRRKARHLLKIRLSLRKRFRGEYLSQLVLFGSKNHSLEFKVGDIVIIEIDNCKRTDWPLGVIEQVIPGKDGKIRLVRLRTANAQLLRPVQRIYPLEINSPSYSLDLNNKLDDMKSAQTNQREISIKPIIAEGVKIVKTRSGRKIRPPLRLGY